MDWEPPAKGNLLKMPKIFSAAEKLKILREHYLVKNRRYFPSPRGLCPRSAKQEQIRPYGSIAELLGHFGTSAENVSQWSRQLEERVEDIFLDDRQRRSRIILENKCAQLEKENAQLRAENDNLRRGFY